MATVESAWDRYPDYRIDLVAVRGTARVWHGDLLLAESDRAVRLIETDHVERLYLPEADVRLGAPRGQRPSHGVPVQGGGRLLVVGRSTHPVEDVFWTYRAPSPKWRASKGYLGVYHEKVRVEIETRLGWRPTASTVHLPRLGGRGRSAPLIEAEPTGRAGSWPRGTTTRTRNVVEGGQLLAQALVAAAKTVPEQRLTSAYITFPKAANVRPAGRAGGGAAPVGPTFSTLSVRGEQSGTLVSPALVLMGSDTTRMSCGTRWPCPRSPVPRSRSPTTCG